MRGGRWIYRLEHIGERFLQKDSGNGVLMWSCNIISIYNIKHIGVYKCIKDIIRTNKQQGDTK